jgi:hypothetical protein
LATLVFSSSGSGGIALTVEIDDAITAKRVAREVDLRATPPDGRALALAVEADELLRATWAEVVVREAPASRSVVPPAVSSIVASSIARTSDEHLDVPRGAIGLRGAVERFTGGITFLGGDVGSEYWFASRWGATLSIGYRVAPSVDSPLGQVSANAVHGGVGPTFAITPRRQTAGLRVAVSLDAWLVHVEPHAGAFAFAIAATDWAATAAATLGGWITIGSAVRACWNFGVALPIRWIEATSDTQAVESTKGLGLVGEVGIEFPYAF